MDKRSCFIIMPYTKAETSESKLDSTSLSNIYENTIKRAILEYVEDSIQIYHEVSRYDSKLGSIINGIIDKLNASDLVIADLTGLNPNVMYELGVRHSLKRGTIIISQDLNTIPSDLRDYMCVEYKFSNDSNTNSEFYNKFKTSIHAAIKEINSSRKVDSPVLNFLDGKQRFWKEDEIKHLKKNLIVTSYITKEYYEIEDMIKAVDESKNYQLIQIFIATFIAKSQNIMDALSDLDIPIDNQEIYETLQAGKSMMQDVTKIFTLKDYFSNALTPLADEQGKKQLQEQLTTVLDECVLDHFKLLEGKIENLTLRQIFHTESPFELIFLADIENYLENRCREYGISEEEIKSIIRE